MKKKPTKRTPKKKPPVKGFFKIYDNILDKKPYESMAFPGNSVSEVDHLGMRCSPPISVTTNVTTPKLEAIVNLSNAICEVAKALNQTLTTINICNNRIVGATKNGIEINGDDR